MPDCIVPSTNATFFNCWSLLFLVSKLYSGCVSALSESFIGTVTYRLNAIKAHQRYHQCGTYFCRLFEVTLPWKYFEVVIVYYRLRNFLRLSFRNYCTIAPLYHCAQLQFKKCKKIIPILGFTLVTIRNYRTESSSQRQQFRENRLVNFSSKQNQPACSALCQKVTVNAVSNSKLLCYMYFETGNCRMRLPVTANIALVNAGAIGGVPGSPPPPKDVSPLLIISILISGISFIRSIL